MLFQISVAGSNVIIRNSKSSKYDGAGLYFTWTNYNDNYNYLYASIENFHLNNGNESHYIMAYSVFGNLTIKNSSIKNMTSGGLNYDIQNYPNMESNLLIYGLLVENVYCGVTINIYGNDAFGSITINNLTYRNSISSFHVNTHNFFVSLNNSLV